jgi:hypothetical protein
MFRVAFKKYAAARDRRIINALSMSVEERYLDFLNTYPAIAVQVPQRMLASYLGVSPDTLSRVRKHLSQKYPATDLTSRAGNPGRFRPGNEVSREGEPKH